MHIYWVELHLVPSKDVEHFRQIGEVVLSMDAFHQHVVDIYFHGLPDLLRKHLVH